MTPEDQDRLRQWADTATESSYYEILGVLELADGHAIQEAFHQFALAFHPDAHPGARPEIREAVTALFRLGVEAYRVLSNDALRARYDRVLQAGQLRLDPSATASDASGASDLERLCKSPGARLAARQADALLTEGRLPDARDALKEALSRDEYDNPALEERIEAVEQAIFIMGG